MVEIVLSKNFPSIGYLLQNVTPKNTYGSNIARAEETEVCE